MKSTSTRQNIFGTYEETRVGFVFVMKIKSQLI